MCVCVCVRMCDVCACTSVCVCYAVCVMLCVVLFVCACVRTCMCAVCMYIQYTYAVGFACGYLIYNYNSIT